MLKCWKTIFGNTHQFTVYKKFKVKNAMMCQIEFKEGCKLQT